MKILIIKTDRVGDFLNISPILKCLHDNNDDIDLVCSHYNYQIAKYYNFVKNFFILEKNLISFIKKNKMYSRDYDVIIQLDGKKTSYLLALFTKSKKKCAIQYKKVKTFFKKKFFITRPNIFIKFFFTDLINCIDDYDIPNNKKYHYLSLYFKILKKLNRNILQKKHYFHEGENIKRNKELNFDDYVLFHIDSRWKSFINDQILSNLINFISKASKKKNIIITSGPDNFMLDRLSLLQNDRVKIIYNTKISEIVSLIKYSNVVISSHSGIIVHLAACFGKNIIDVVPSSIFNELDRWIPFDINYKRYSINEILQIDL